MVRGQFEVQAFNILFLPLESLPVGTLGASVENRNGGVCL
jgi:hypothetical protein